MTVPAYVRKYFWEIDTNKASPDSHPGYYISRLLEYGDKKSFLWLKKVFGLALIKSRLERLKISKKAKNFWRIQFQQHV